MKHIADLKVFRTFAACYNANLRNYWFNMSEWPRLIFRMFVIQTGVHFGLFALYMLQVNRRLPFTLPDMGRPFELASSASGLCYLSLSPIVAFLFHSIIWAPIIEELRYRGLVWLSIVYFRSRFVHVFVIIVSSVIWAFLHQRALLGTAEIISAGILASMLVVKTRNIIPAMLFHSLWNAMVTVCAIFKLV